MSEKLMFDQDISDIRTDVDGDILFLSCGKYKLFMAHGKPGHDAMVLYLHLMWTARMQATTKVRATVTYLMKGLSWRKERVIDAKKLLFDLDLICPIVRRNTDGSVKGWYVQVNMHTTIAETSFTLDQTVKPVKRDIAPPPHPDSYECRELFKSVTQITNWAKEGKAIKRLLANYTMADIRLKVNLFVSKKAAGERFFKEAQCLPSILAAVWDNLVVSDDQKDLDNYLKEKGYK